jgi:uncharacterized protein DUF3999
VSAIDAGPAWSAWTRVTPVAVAPARRERYVRVRLPFAIAPADDGGYPDLRVVDAQGNELPYALDPAREAPAERALDVIDVGFVPHRWTQAVLDLGTAAALVDAVTLDAGGRATFFQQVAVDASDDRTTWRIVRDDAIVYRVAQDGGRGSTTVTFPPTRSRWLRVRVLDPHAAFLIAGARSAMTPPREPPLSTLPVPRGEATDRVARTRTWTFAAATPMRATAVVFAPGSAYYERKVRVEASSDAKDWVPTGDGTISRYAEGGAQLTIALNETTARFVRVTVENGNDAPVRGLAPRLLGRAHDVVFESRAEPYRLLSGNPGASAPRYDLGARLAHETWRAALARADATVANAGYRDVRPVGERFPWLISGALILVAVGLGALAIRTVRRSKDDPSSTDGA